MAVPADPSSDVLSADVLSELLGTQPLPRPVAGRRHRPGRARRDGAATLWLLSRNAVTIAHEGGHGLVALLTGRRLQGACGCTRTPAASP